MGNRLKPIIPIARQLARNSATGMLRSLVVALTLFIVYPIYIRELGTEIFGVWVIISAVTIWAQFGALGMPQTVMKFVAGSAAKGDREELLEYVSSALSILLISGIVVILILFIVKGAIAGFLHVPRELKASTHLYILFSGSIVILDYMARSVNAILSGIGRMDIANFNEMAAKVFSALFSIFLIYKGYGIWALFFGAMVNSLIMLLIGFMISIYLLGVSPFSFGSIRWGRVIETLNFGGTLTAGALLAMFIEPFNRFILGQYVSLSAAALYDVASRVVLQLRGVLEGCFRPFVAQSSAYITSGQEEKIRELSRLSVRLVFFIGVPMFLVLIVWAPELMGFWLKGTDMPGISYALRGFAFAYIFSLMVTPAYYLFMGIGRKEVCFRVFLLFSISNSLLVLICLFLGLISLNVVINIFAFSLIFSSVYLMLMAYKSFGERYFVDYRNLSYIALAIISIFIFKIVGILLGFHSTLSLMLCVLSFIFYLGICYIAGLIPMNTIFSYLRDDKSGLEETG